MEQPGFGHDVGRWVKRSERSRGKRHAVSGAVALPEPPTIHIDGQTVSGGGSLMTSVSRHFDIQSCEGNDKRVFS